MISYDDYFRKAEFINAGGGILHSTTPTPSSTPPSTGGGLYSNPGIYKVTYKIIEGTLISDLANAQSMRINETSRIDYSSSNKIIIEIGLQDVTPLNHWLNIPENMIRGDMTLDMIALINHNMPSNTSVKIEAHTAFPVGVQQFTFDTHRSDQVDNRRYYATDYFALPQTVEYVNKIRIEITKNPLDTQNHLEIGRLWASRAVRFEENTGIDGGWDISYKDGGAVSRSIAGSVYAREEQVKRQINVPVRLVKKRQAIGTDKTLQDMLVRTGKTEELIAIMDRQTPYKWTMNVHGMLTNEPVLSHHAGLFSTDLQIREL